MLVGTLVYHQDCVHFSVDFPGSCLGQQDPLSGWIRTWVQDWWVVGMRS